MTDSKPVVDHRELAMDMLHDARIEGANGNDTERSYCMAAAQVHAILALVDAVAGGAPVASARAEHDSRHRGACDCRTCEQHAHTELLTEKGRVAQMVDEVIGHHVHGCACHGCAVARTLAERGYPVRTREVGLR